MTFAFTTLIFLSIIVAYEIYSKRNSAHFKKKCAENNDLQMKQLLQIIGGDTDGLDN